MVKKGMCQRLNCPCQLVTITIMKCNNKVANGNIIMIQISNASSTRTREMKCTTDTGVKIVHEMRPQELVNVYFDGAGREGDVDFRYSKVVECWVLLRTVILSDDLVF